MLLVLFLLAWLSNSKDHHSDEKPLLVHVPRQLNKLNGRQIENPKLSGAADITEWVHVQVLSSAADKAQKDTMNVSMSMN